ncbi:hypothetical protein [Clostridium sp. HBUAS56010]|uniref:hypothetical protein n=1 Tax=Clostridium sp. HBUAS56010 TaxID=2571127 RepID=UPI001177C168|nr:hypothetical protein [Clostridium sp. HBUAS56010]
MSLYESHQLARELTLEYIRENRIFSIENSFDGMKRDRDEMIKAYFSIYEDFRISIEDYADQHSYAKEIKINSTKNI